MDFAEGNGLLARCRGRLKEAYTELAIFLAGAYLIIGLDILTSPGSVAHRSTIGREEALLLIGIMAMGPIAFLLRRQVERKHQAARDLTTEAHVHSIAFQNALHAMMSQPMPKQLLKVRDIEAKDK